MVKDLMRVRYIANGKGSWLFLLYTFKIVTRIMTDNITPGLIRILRISIQFIEDV